MSTAQKKNGKRSKATNRAAARKLKSLAWLAGNEDWTKSPVYKTVAQAVNNVARGGPLNISGSLKPSKRRKLLSVDNEVVSFAGGKLSNIGSSQSSSRPHTTTIPERMERISTIYSQVDFLNVQKCYINPGISSCFPWLSQIANAYELYSFKKLWFEYRTTSGEVSGTSPALGKVVMTTNYDPDASPFVNIQEMENYEGNCNFPPFQGVARHYVNVSGSNMGSVLPYKRRYVRAGPVPVNSPQGGSPDPHAYDVGLFQVGVQGCPPGGSVPIGELWVGYSIDLIKPRVVQQSLTSARWAVRFTYGIDGAFHINSLVAAEAYYQNNIPYVASSYSANSMQVNLTLSLAKGNYLIIVKQTVSGTTLGGPLGLNYGGNVTQTVGVNGFRSPVQACYTGVNGAEYDYVQVTDDLADTGIALTVGSHVAASTSGTIDFYVQQCPFPAPPVTSSLFAKSTLALDVERLTKKLEALTAEQEEKEELFSVVSSLAQNRENSTRVAMR